MTPKNIKCNFKSVFAQFNTIEEITELANHICAQVKSSYDARKDELEGTEAIVEAIVEIESEKEQEEPKKVTKKTGSKIERAKEMAAKFKNDAKKASETKDESKAKKGSKKETRGESKKEQKTESSNDTLIAVTDVKAIKELGLSFEKYNDRCYVLRGNTKPLRKVLKEEFKGVFNGRLTGGEGWVIGNKYAQPCAKALGLKISAA